MLDLSKLEAGKEDLDIQEQDLFQLCQQIFNENSAKIQEKSIDFILKPPTTAVTVPCDKNKILQVLSNLIANAVNYSPEQKKIVMTIEKSQMILGRRESDTEKVDGVLLSLSDQGVGIPDAELKTIFNKFIQSSKTKDGSGGTGLGLAICYEIISAHKGTIWAEHNPEGGAIFKLFLRLDNSKF